MLFVVLVLGRGHGIYLVLLFINMVTYFSLNFHRRVAEDAERTNFFVAVDPPNRPADRKGGI